MALLLILAAVLVGGWLYSLRVREVAREETERAHADMIRGGDEMKALSDDELHTLHASIHQELKRRFSTGGE